MADMVSPVITLTSADADAVRIFLVGNRAQLRQVMTQRTASRTGLVVEPTAVPLLGLIARLPWRVVLTADDLAHLPARRAEIESALDHRGRYISPKLVEPLMDALGRYSAAADPVHSLSPREREVADALLAGGTNRQIAAALFVSEHTVRNQLGSIYRKLGVRTRQEARDVLGDHTSLQAALG